MVCCFCFGGGGGGGGCAARRSVTSTDVQAFACFMCAATPLTCVYPTFTPSTRRSKKDAVSRTRGENVHCLISCAYSMGALGMPMVFGFREEAVGERWTLVGLFGGGV